MRTDMKIFALAAFALIAASPAFAAAPAPRSAEYEKACGSQPNAKERADCTAQIKQCVVQMAEQIKLHPGDDDGMSLVESCRLSIFEDADSGTQ